MRILDRLIHVLEELWIVLFSWIPTPLGIFLRLIAWKFIFKKCGNVRFGTSLTLSNCKNISLGDGVRIGRNCFLTSGNGILILNDNVSLSPCVHIGADDGFVEIGKHCAVGPGTVIRAANHNFSDKEKPIMYQGHSKGKIIIENDVWIGANCVITPDVRIGKGAVIGAGAVVTHNVASFAVVAGVPAKVISYRGVKPHED